MAFFLEGWLLKLLKISDLRIGRMPGLNIAILAQAVGVPVGRCSGGQLAMLLVATINVIIFSIFFAGTAHRAGSDSMLILCQFVSL